MYMYISSSKDCLPPSSQGELTSNFSMKAGSQGVDLVFLLFQQSHTFLEGLLDSAPRVKDAISSSVHKPYLRIISLFCGGKEGMVGRIRDWLSLTPWLPWLVPGLFSLTFGFLHPCQFHFSGASIKFHLKVGALGPCSCLRFFRFIMSTCQVFFAVQKLVIWCFAKDSNNSMSESARMTLKTIYLALSVICDHSYHPHVLKSKYFAGNLWGHRHLFCKKHLFFSFSALENYAKGHKEI